MLPFIWPGISYQAKFLIIRDLRNKPLLSMTLDGKPVLFGLVVEADPKYKDRDFCIVLETGERIKSIDVKTDLISEKLTEFTLNFEDRVVRRYALTEVKPDVQEMNEESK